MTDLEALKKEMDRFGITEKGIHFCTSVYFNEYVAAIGVGKTNAIDFEDIRDEAKKFHQNQTIKGILVKQYNKKSEDDITAKERRIFIGERIPVGNLIEECERVGEKKSYFSVDWLQKYQADNPELEYVVERDANDPEKIIRGIKLRKTDIIVSSEEELAQTYENIKKELQPSITTNQIGEATINTPIGDKIDATLVERTAKKDDRTNDKTK